jgi:hypothetical protein
MSSYAAKVMHDDGEQMVYLVTGLRAAIPVWCYAMVPSRTRASFSQAVRQGKVNIAQFGQILFSGQGIQPPQEIEAIVSNYYSD